MTDINLSIDDRYLYVSCFGTGEFIQYDVSDPFKPKKVSSIRLGGIVSRAAHPSKPGQMLNGGPQMVEISRDGKRIYFTNSLYTKDTKDPKDIRGFSLVSLVSFVLAYARICGFFTGSELSASSSARLRHRAQDDDSVAGDDEHH